MTIRKDQATLSDVEKQDFVAAILALNKCRACCSRVRQDGAATTTTWSCT